MKGLIVVGIDCVIFVYLIFSYVPFVTFASRFSYFLSFKSLNSCKFYGNIAVGGAALLQFHLVFFSVSAYSSATYCDEEKNEILIHFRGPRMYSSACRISYAGYNMGESVSLHAACKVVTHIDVADNHAYKVLHIILSIQYSAY